jgi:myo-inositol 2-dehydrogenase / D-chiro-inositol 1-dehydrogenase
MPGRRVGVGIVGTGFIARVHYSCLARNPDAAVLAVSSPTPGRAEAFARERGVPAAFADYRDLLALAEVELVFVATPNATHAPITIDAARAGKHVVVEKPMCLSLVEADRMLEAAEGSGVKLMHAEEFCFAPKYVRAKQIVDEGGLGRVFRVKHSERYYGPINPIYRRLETSGGWCAMQLGSHSIGIIRWILGKPRATAVTAHMGRYVHEGEGEDDSLIVIEFGDRVVAVAENSWGKRGGMEDRLEILGTDGLIQADLYQETGIRTYSEGGYAYSAPGAAPRQGWTHTVFEELWGNGFPQEDDHFVACVRDDLPPQESGQDGRAMIEILMAAYESARTGRRVELPFASTADRPIDHWHGKG